MSTLMTAEIVNAVVLAAVLEGDLGSHRKITKFRLLRPLLTTAFIVPLFLGRSPPTAPAWPSSWPAWPPGWPWG